MDAVKTPTDIKRARQGRSPAYPGIDLKAALAKAKALYDQEGKYPAPMPSAFSAWGFSAKSSGGREVRAALRYFGLITVEGDGDAGKVKLSDRALRILLDEREDQSEKWALIRELALTPPIHQRIHERFPEGIKSDATAEHFLMFDEGYNKTACGDLVSEFKSTADFAGLYKPDIMPVKADKKPITHSPSDCPVIGDLVQVEIGGAFQLDKPARVRSIQELDGQKWVFIEGSETGIPMEQIIVQSKAPPPPSDIGATPPRLPLEPVADLPMAKSEREWLRGPLSKETNYRLIVSGDLGPREIGKLIKLLEAQKAVLTDDDED
jgi:hypothetical protein